MFKKVCAAKLVCWQKTFSQVCRSFVDNCDNLCGRAYKQMWWFAVFGKCFWQWMV